VKIVQEHHGAFEVVRPRGPLVAEDANQLRRRVNKVLEEHGPSIVLDLSSVPYADSQGLETLADLAEQWIRTGQTLRICGLNDTLREVLDLTDLTSLFEQFEEVPSAVGSGT